jgi:hypothetical protein
LKVLYLPVRPCTVRSTSFTSTDSLTCNGSLNKQAACSDR